MHFERVWIRETTLELSWCLLAIRVLKRWKTSHLPYISWLVILSLRERLLLFKILILRYLNRLSYVLTVQTFGFLLILFWFSLKINALSFSNWRGSIWNVDKLILSFYVLELHLQIHSVLSLLILVCLLIPLYIWEVPRLIRILQTMF